MLAELLMVMAGHASAFFVVTDRPSSSSPSKRIPWSWTLRLIDGDTSSDVLRLLHPGERASLEALAGLAAKHLRIQLFAKALLARARSQALSSCSNTSKRSKKPATIPQSALFAPLASCLLRLLKGYQQLILDIESDILLRKEDIVDGDDAFVSLAIVRARFEEWQSPLSALDALVSALLSGPEPSEQSSAAALETPIFDGSSHTPSRPPVCPFWPSGKLLDLLGLRADTGVGSVRACMSSLVCAVEDAWRGALVAWMCYGDAQDASTFGIGSDPLVEWGSHGGDPLAQSISYEDGHPHNAMGGGESNRDDDSRLVDQRIGKAVRITGWQFVPNALPSSISQDPTTAEAILYVGRALHSVKNRSVSHLSHMGPRMLPETLTSSHVALLRSDQARPSTRPMDFRRAVARIREDVSEWMWRNVLTPEVVLGTFHALGDYFLHRDGLYALSLLEELSKLRHAKLTGTRTAVAGTIKKADIEIALQRASVGTEAEKDNHLELCEVLMPPRSPSNTNDWKPTKLQGIQDPTPKTPMRFDDIALGVPFTLFYSAPFPLDLILSTRDLRAYSDIFSYLIALHAAQTRLRDCWTNMGKAQRSRRRFTGTGEGGVSKREEAERTRLLRMAWGAAREGLWFLEALGGHFQTDIIEVQYTRFLDQLESLRPASQRAPRHERDSSGDSLPVRSRVPSIATRKSVPSSLAAPAATASAAARARKESASSIARLSTRQTPFPSSSAHAGTGAISSVIPPWQGRNGNAAASIAAGTGTMRRTGLGGASGSTMAPSVAATAVYAGTTPGEGKEGRNSSGLDFATSRSMHQAFLSFVLDGLLLTSTEASACVRRILQTCLRLAALVDRWGGDVLPDLLSEGSVLASSSHGGVGQGVEEQQAYEGSEISATLRERSRMIGEVAEALRMHLDEFFAILSHASSMPSSTVPKEETQRGNHPRDAQTTGISSAASGTKQQTTTATTNNAAARLDADSGARRHLEQLLLVLDYNGYLSARTASQVVTEE